MEVITNAVTYVYDKVVGPVGVVSDYVFGVGSDTLVLFSQLVRSVIGG